MTVFERLKISAQVALQWDRKDYRLLTQAQAWDEGYDSYDDGVLVLEPDNTVDVVAMADPNVPTAVEIIAGRENWELDMETGAIIVFKRG